MNAISSNPPFTRITHVSFHAPFYRGHLAAPVQNGMRLHNLMVSLPIKSATATLTCRLKMAGDGSFVSAATVEYSPDCFESQEPHKFKNRISGHVDFSSTILRQQADPRPRSTAWLRKEMLDTTLNQVRIACYFAADATGAEAMIERVRAHNIDVCKCVSTSGGHLQLTPRGNSARNVTAEFSTAHRVHAWRTLEERVQGGVPVIEKLAHNGAICVELNVSKKWLMAHAATHARDWDNVDLTDFCLKEIIRFVSTDFDSYWRQNKSVGFASTQYSRIAREIAARKRAVLEVMHMRDIRPATSSDVLAPQSEDASLQLMFDASNLVTYSDVMFKAGAH